METLLFASLLSGFLICSGHAYVVAGAGAGEAFIWGRIDVSACVWHNCQMRGKRFGGTRRLLHNRIGEEKLAKLKLKKLRIEPVFCQAGFSGLGT